MNETFNSLSLLNYDIFYLSSYLAIYLPACLSVSLSICLSIYRMNKPSSFFGSYFYVAYSCYTVGDECVVPVTNILK